MFKRYDANGDGKVSYDEFVAAWTEPTVKPLTDTDTMYRDPETILAELTPKGAEAR